MADLKEIKMHDSDLTISFDGLTISLDKYVGIEKETASAAKKRIEDRKKEQAPSAILFVHGFDSLKSEDEIKVALNSIAPVKKVMIRKNFCFVRFSCVADATKVMVFFHGKEVLGFVLSIEYGMPMQSSSSSNTASSTAPVAIDRAPHWNPLGSKDDRNERDSRYKEDKGNDRNGGNRKGNSSHIENSQRDNRQTSGDRIRNINDTERRGIRKDGESSGSYSRDTKNLSTRDIREIRSNNNSLAFGSRKDTLYSGESTRRNGTKRCLLCVFSKLFNQMYSFVYLFRCCLGVELFRSIVCMSVSYENIDNIIIQWT
jgi:RNA recognition motif-containing protein